MPDQPQPADSGEQAILPVAKPVKFVHRQLENLPTFFADGGWGVLNHYNLIRIGFYTENPPVATSVIQPVLPDGTANGDQIHADERDSEFFVINRDFQCQITLTVPSAIQVYQMLGSFIRLAQEQLRDQSMTMQQQMKAAAETKASQQPK
jgi:hypothetical protein